MTLGKNLGQMNSTHRHSDNELQPDIIANTLRDLAANLSRSLDLDTVMGMMFDALGRIVRHDAANIMLIEGSYARIAHLHGYPALLLKKLKSQSFPIYQLINFRQMIETGQARLVNDTRIDLNWYPLEEWLWTRAYLGVPIKVNNETIAFLNLDSNTPQAFTAQDAENLTAFAQQSAHALNNARLYTAARRDAEELKRLQRASTILFASNLFGQTSAEAVGTQIVQTVMSEFDTLACAVLLFDPQTQQFTPLAQTSNYQLPANPALLTDVIEKRKHLYIPDLAEHLFYSASTPDARSEFALPLQAGQRLLGVLDILNAESYAFAEPDRRILQSFAQVAAVAIENNLLYEQVSRYALELEQRVAERSAELTHVKERVETILNNSSDAIVLLNEQGHIRQTNNAFNRLFDYPEEGAFNLPIEMLAQPTYATALREAFQQVIKHKRPARIELVTRTAAGSSFNADVVLSPALEHDEQITTVICSLRDITDRKQAELRLQHTLRRERELSQLKSHFITMASHEFRTPLATIMTSADLLSMYGDRMTEAQKQERIELIKSQVDHLTNLLTDLLAASDVNRVAEQALKPELVELDGWCRQLIRDFEASIDTQHRLHYEPNGECRALYLDLRLTRKVLINLLSNAVRYSLPGSAIYLSLRCEDDRAIFQIRDEGIGMPDEDQPALFETFQRGRNVSEIPGAGLGLAIVKHAVELQNGSIQFASQVGVGTTFTVTIPEMRLKEDHDETNPRY